MVVQLRSLNYKKVLQGDPLTPFLFLITREGLARVVRQAMENDIIKGIEVGFSSNGTLFIYGVCCCNEKHSKMLTTYVRVESEF